VQSFVCVQSFYLSVTLTRWLTLHRRSGTKPSSYIPTQPAQWTPPHSWSCSPRER
jgi:hypothetical protein